MKTCPSCDRKVASNATICPGCGHRFHTFLAQLFFWLVGVPVLVAIVYGLVAGTP